MNQTKQYIQSLYEDKDSLIQSMQQYAEEHGIPIMEKDGIEFLKQLIRIHKPKSIVEIGAAIGYSAIQMASSNSEVKVHTVERDEQRYHDAIYFIKQAGLEARINITHDNAINWLNQFSNDLHIDFVFVDAAKGEYKDYVEKIDPFLKPGSLLVVDNVLFKGYVSKEKQENRRFVKIGDKIASFNEWLYKHPHYTTTIVETGDGVAIAIKTNEE
ncbi:O-methyltransferase [Alkalibacillus silvisoli]|uniref:tRNA 5-hydroxyuridine methyltransferase n=1 Tax=Alkalibacillus silvisoli TaxID=392823 RepID=A0ABN0ZS28_9BACI